MKMLYNRKQQKMNKNVLGVMRMKVILKADIKGVGKKDEIINALKEHIDNVNTVENITTADITNLLIDKNKRDYLCEKLQLGKCNNKAFIKRLNYLEFTLDELKQYGNK